MLNIEFNVQKINDIINFYNLIYLSFKKNNKKSVFIFKGLKVICTEDTLFTIYYPDNISYCINFHLIDDFELYSISFYCDDFKIAGIFVDEFKSEIYNESSDLDLVIFSFLDSLISKHSVSKKISRFIE